MRVPNRVNVTEKTEKFNGISTRPKRVKFWAFALRKWLCVTRDHRHRPLLLNGRSMRSRYSEGFQRGTVPYWRVMPQVLIMKSRKQVTTGCQGDADGHTGVHKPGVTPPLAPGCTTITCKMTGAFSEISHKILYV